MRLTLDQIKSIAFGAVEIAEEEKGIRFYRCTENQIAGNSNNPDNYAVNSTGVRLDFHTDSEAITFDAEMAREWGANFEVLVDNLMIGHYCFDKLKDEDFPIVQRLPKGEKRVTLLFPILRFEVWLKYVELDDGATLVPHKYTGKKLYFVGDSITQGWTAQYNFTAFPHAISRRFDSDFVSSGIGGLHFRHQVIDKIPYDPDYAIIMIGTNNWNGSKSSNMTLERFNQVSGEFMDKFAECFPNVTTIVISPTWRTDSEEYRPMGTMREMSQSLEASAKAHGFLFIDGFKLIPPYSAFISDNVHPNELGFMVMSERLAEELEKLVDLK